MTYGEFGAVLDTQSNAHVQQLLDHNVVLEMDGLSNAADRVLFSEALTLYLYRYRLAQGPRDQLTNMIVLEEAHNLLLAKAPGTRESVLETSIRMIRQYGVGYVFVDQSASLLSKVAFANSYATIALSQKLRADVQTMAGAMNLSDEQKQALNTLPIGTAVVRLADENPEPFLIKVPRCPIREGAVTDTEIRQRMAGCSGDSAPVRPSMPGRTPIAPIPCSDRTGLHSPSERGISHPTTSPRSLRQRMSLDRLNRRVLHPKSRSRGKRSGSWPTSRASRWPARSSAISGCTSPAAAATPSGGTLLRAGLIEAVALATRSGQVVLHQLTEDAPQPVAQALGRLPVAVQVTQVMTGLAAFTGCPRRPEGGMSMVPAEGQHARDQGGNRRHCQRTPIHRPVDAQQRAHQQARSDGQTRAGPGAAHAADGLEHHPSQHDQREADRHRPEIADRPAVRVLPGRQSHGKRQADGHRHHHRPGDADRTAVRARRTPGP